MPHVFQEVHDQLAQMDLGIPPGKILNVGAGRRADWAKACQRFKGRDIIQTDMLPHEGLDRVADAENLPFDDGIFAGVFSIAMLEHVRHPWIAFREMARVLMPGGLLLIIAPWIWEYHKAPVDYWRFHTTAYPILAEGTGLAIMKTGFFSPTHVKHERTGFIDSWAVLRKG